MKLTPAPLSTVQRVADAVATLGLQSRVGPLVFASCSVVRVSRDAMCDANPRRGGGFESMPEEWAYPRTLEVIRFLFPDLYFMWGMKDDDDYSLEVYAKE